MSAGTKLCSLFSGVIPEFGPQGTEAHKTQIVSTISSVLTHSTNNNTNVVSVDL